MEVRVEALGRATVLRPAGRLDGPGAGKFRLAVEARLARAAGPLVVDLAEVAALPGVGAEALAWLAARQRGAGLALARPRPAAAALLAAVGLAAAIPVRATVAEALAALPAAEG